MANPSEDRKQQQLQAAREAFRRKQQRRRWLREDAKKLRDVARKARKDLTAKEEQLGMVRERLAEVSEQVKAKDAKLARFRREPGGTIRYVEEKYIFWYPKPEQIGQKAIYSPSLEVGGLPFRLSVKTMFKSGVKYLSFFLHCNDEVDDPTFVAKVDAELCLSKRGVTSSDRTKAGCTHFSSARDVWGVDRFIRWDEAMANRQAHPGSRGDDINEDCFHLNARVKLMFHYENAVADFESPNPPLTDVVLVLEGRQFYTNRVFLAHFSDYFKALFFDDFAEAKKDQVELEADPDEFEELLRMLYPQYKKTKITAFNVESLLGLADRFHIPYVTWQCIRFLRSTKDCTAAEKLDKGEQYRLPELQDYIFEDVEKKGAVALKAIIDSEEFELYSFALKATLLKKYVECTDAQARGIGS